MSNFGENLLFSAGASVSPVFFSPVLAVDTLNSEDSQNKLGSYLQNIWIVARWVVVFVKSRKLCIYQLAIEQSLLNLSFKDISFYRFQHLSRSTLFLPFWLNVIYWPVLKQDLERPQPSCCPLFPTCWSLALRVVAENAVRNHRPSLLLQLESWPSRFTNR